MVQIVGMKVSPLIPPIAAAIEADGPSEHIGGRGVAGSFRKPRHACGACAAHESAVQPYRLCVWHRRPHGSAGHVSC